MVVAPAGGLVELPGVDSENEGKNGEEHARDLKGEDAGGVGEGTPERRAESSCAASETAGAFGD